MRSLTLPLVLATLLLAATRLFAAVPDAQDLKRLSIEELMQVDITLTSRQEAPVGTADAAVSVITGDDIRRSGATTLADALTMADGVHVARLNNGTWAISARGFNTTTANKMLVMVDGMTVYSPLFTGVFWNTLDYVLEDVDRIEIIRGPGATLWGANAVNGVINIVTRSAADSQGALVTATVGSQYPFVVSTRYGGTNRAVAWRVYAKTARQDAQTLAGGGSAGDQRDRGQAGFRLDGGAADGRHWLLKGDAFHSRDELLARSPGEFTTLDLQGRWSTPAWAGGRATVQSYFRREYRRVPQQLTHSVDTGDVDAQYAGMLARRHSLVIGGGTRVNSDRTFDSPTLRFDPPSRAYIVSNVFAQDDVTLVPDRLDATLGAKWEHNEFSGGELQPNVRGRLRMTRGQVLWGAVSRAVRRPTRFEEDLIVSLPTGQPLVRGDDRFIAESLVATEVGYRIQPWPQLSVDATVFHHDYTDLRSQDLPPGGGLPLLIGNSLQGTSHGLELAINVQPLAAWRTHISYTRLDVDVTRAPGSRDVSGGTSEGDDPDHLFSIRTSVDLPARLEADAQLRTVGALPQPAVPGYTELNARLGWRTTPRVELFLSGQDLLHAQHPEFTSGGIVEQFHRSVRVGTTLRF